MLGGHASNGNRRASTAGAWESYALAGLLLMCVAISARNLIAIGFWQPAALRQPAPWCAPGQQPTFEFGFGALAGLLGDIMGQPIECEHGIDSSSNTRQITTTGVATYFWCTNTPTFTRGQEHWMLTPQGLIYWTGDGNPPVPLPIVRAPDLRELCPT